MEADKATLRQNLLRLASLAETYGGKPTDYCDAGEELNAYARFCIDETALIVLGAARKKSMDKIRSNDEKDGDKGKGDGKVPRDANNVSVLEALKAKSQAELVLAQRKAMMR